jgi:hypothetical protein
VAEFDRLLEAVEERVRLARGRGEALELASERTQASFNRDSSSSRSSITLLLTSRASVTSGGTVRSRVAGVSSRAIFWGWPSSSTRIWSGLRASRYAPFFSTWKRT